MKRLKELRKLSGKSQEEVANDLNITRQSYSFYENGRREPSNDMLLKLADYYGVSTDYLLDRTESPLEILGMKDVPEEFIYELREADTKIIYELWSYLQYLNMKKGGALKQDIANR